MLWDVWIVEDDKCRLIAENLSNTQWLKLLARVDSRMLFRVPAGFVCSASLDCFSHLV